jgi:hypothetical protein
MITDLIDFKDAIDILQKQYCSMIEEFLKHHSIEELAEIDEIKAIMYYRQKNDTTLMEAKTYIEGILKDKK